MSVLDRLTDVPGVAPGPGYSHAVVTTGRLAFVSGQVSKDEHGELVGPGDLAAQTERSLLNLHAVLRELGADWPDVARFTWYVTDASQVQVIRDVRDRLIRPALGDRPNPASSLVQVAALFDPAFLIEVEAVVALP
ncbi:RidA family protein [Bailinhaonella thermotolerans]|uniref:RidA family protein n=1 Tax=Bailinhaonella thermotolerans TaxID=1070861 RepID=A0A3A4A6H6_9ACTN|nr:RidA family protein [Bailinhaonella thermotolerans]RJL24175.1 RidA family protein [Bailinhaonella thermotolerans]